MTETAAPAAPKLAELPKELTEFLVELSIGVHRFAMYPEEHPSLAAAVENITRRLDDLFEERASISIGVAQKQLVIEGTASDNRHALLADLARRLHDHQLGALTLRRGVDAAQVWGVLSALASETERGGTPLGMLPASERPSWEDASLHKVGYDRLELVAPEGEETADFHRADALWLGLAQAALASEDKLQVSPDASSVAKVIREHKPEQAYDQVIVGYLLQLADELKDKSGEDSERVRARVSKLISELDDGTLSRLVRFGDNAIQRRRFVLDASQSLAVESVVKVLEAAATNEEQGISNSMTRLLSKLAVHAERGSAELKTQATNALRENVEALIQGWELKDPNPESYTNVLDAISRAVPVLHNPLAEDESLTGAQRIVEMALEVDAFGPIVDKALTDFLAEGGAGTLLGHVKRLPRSNRLANRIHDQLTSPDQFRDLLTGGNMEEGVFKTLVEEMGPTAAKPLLDVLAEAESRAERTRLFAALLTLGPNISEPIQAYLADSRWYVVRNMLCLLQRLGELPEHFDPVPFLEHEDPRVRREAMPLAMRRDDGRERVLVLALADDDEDVVRMALSAVQHEVPDAVLPTLVNRVVLARERPPELRSLAVKALGGSRSPLALTTLVDLCTAGWSFFGRTRLARPTQDMLVALRTLAAGWADRGEAKKVLDLARRSKDGSIRGAVRLTSSSLSPGSGGTK